MVQIFFTSWWNSNRIQQFIDQSILLLSDLGWHEYTRDCRSSPRTILNLGLLHKKFDVGQLAPTYFFKIFRTRDSLFDIINGKSIIPLPLVNRDAYLGKRIRRYARLFLWLRHMSFLNACFVFMRMIAQRL